MNFLTFIPDELRADALGCYGNSRISTPNFDRLAAEGTRFEQCHAQHPVCSPSRCSFMTGWYPHVRGHRSLWNLLKPDEPNLLRYLKNTGYDVFFTGKNDLLAADSYADSVTATEVPTRSPLHDQVRWATTPPYERNDPRYYSFLYNKDTVPKFEQLTDVALVDSAARFIRSRPSRPYALFVNSIFPHCPYYSPAEFFNRIDPASLPPLRPSGLPGKPDFHELIRRYRRLGELDEATLRKIRAVYYGMTEVADRCLGMLLDALDDSGQKESTAVITFSDHGEWAGDYGLVEKWPSCLDDTHTRVPLIARIPGGESGHTVREQVELVDVLPTVLDLAGVEATHRHMGRSLVPQLQGAAGDPTRHVFAEGGYDLEDLSAFEGAPGDLADPAGVYWPKGRQQQEHPESVCRAVMIRSLTHKLIHRPRGQSELYDLASDPQELCNRHGAPALAAVQADLEKRLLNWFALTSDVVPAHKDKRGHPRESR